jgi:hypothetical protein
MNLKTKTLLLVIFFLIGGSLVFESNLQSLTISPESYQELKNSAHDNEDVSSERGPNVLKTLSSASISSDSILSLTTSPLAACSYEASSEFKVAVNSSGQLIINDKHESLTEDVLKANKLNFHRVTHNTTTSIFEEDELFAALNTLMSPAKIASEEYLKSSLTATAFSIHETILFLIIFLLLVTIGSYLIFPNKIKRSIIGRSKSHLSDQP